MRMAKSGQEYIACFTALRQALQASQGEPSCWSQKKHPLYISQKITPRTYFPKIYRIKHSLRAPWLRPSRPSGAQALWPMQITSICICYIGTLVSCLGFWANFGCFGQFYPFYVNFRRICKFRPWRQNLAISGKFWPFRANFGHVG